MNREGDLPPIHLSDSTPFCPSAPDQQSSSPRDEADAGGQWEGSQSTSTEKVWITGGNPAFTAQSLLFTGLQVSKHKVFETEETSFLT